MADDGDLFSRFFEGRLGNKVPDRVRQLIEEAADEATGAYFDDGIEYAQKDAVESIVTQKRAQEIAKERLAADEEADRIAAGDLTGWEHVDLTPYLDGSHVEPVPSVLRVRVPGGGDDRHVFYVGVNWIFGESGDGKSMVATVATAQVLLDGGTVVWIDYEEKDAVTLCSRLLAMGVCQEQIKAGLIFRHPETRAQQKNLDTLVEEAIAQRDCGVECVRLVVLDSVGEAFGVESINENNDVEVSPWVNKVLRRLAKGLPYAAVLPVDHSTKSKEYKLHPSGSKRKRAAVTGLMVLVESETPFSRTEPGGSKLICAKDRHGTYTRGKEIALMSVDGCGGMLAVDVHERGLGEAAVDEQEKSLFDQRVDAVIKAAALAGPVGMPSSEAFDKAWSDRGEKSAMPTNDMKKKILAALSSPAHPYVTVTGNTTAKKITVYVVPD